MCTVVDTVRSLKACSGALGWISSLDSDDVYDVWLRCKEPEWKIWAACHLLPNEDVVVPLLDVYINRVTLTRPMTSLVYTMNDTLGKKHCYLELLPFANACKDWHNKVSYTCSYLYTVLVNSNPAVQPTLASAIVRNLEEIAGKSAVLCSIDSFIYPEEIAKEYHEKFDNTAV